MIQEWDLPNDLVLIAGEGHWWIALDNRFHVDDNPPLVYLDEDNNLEIQIEKTLNIKLQTCSNRERINHSIEPSKLRLVCVRVVLFNFFKKF